MQDDTRNPTREQVIEALRRVQDPELPVNLYDLGLIYELSVEANGEVHVGMTLTTPNCPVAESMPAMVKKAVEGVPGVTRAEVRLVWEPAWTGERMTEAARMQLDMMGIDWSKPMKKGPTSLTIKQSGARRSGDS